MILGLKLKAKTTETSMDEIPASFSSNTLSGVLNDMPENQRL